MSVEQIYEEFVSHLPKDEQIGLAVLIMWKCGERGCWDFSDEWSEEDLRDMTVAGWRLIDERLSEEERDAWHRVTLLCIPCPEQ